MLRLVSVALAVSSVAALQPPARGSAAAKANPGAVDLYSRATTASAARDVALYGMFGPSEAEKRAEQARIDAEQEALNEKFRKESESDFAFMSVFGVVTRGRGVLGMCLRDTMTTSVRHELSRTRWGPAHAIAATHSDDARRSLPIVYLIYLAFQVDPEEVGAGGIY